MITTNEYLKSVYAEIQIIKHLASKLTAEDLEYRPSPKQRSMLELLQYLTNAGISTAINIMTGNWDHMAEMAEKSKTVTLETFADAMDTQFTAMKELMKDVTEAELLEKDAAMPWGEPIKAGAAFINMPLKCLTAYRMQLFLYAKAVGLTEIGSANCWVGVDMPVQE